jgi:hypothetical protein
MARFLYLLLIFLLLIVALSHGKRFGKRDWFDDLLDEPRSAKRFDYQERHVKYKRKYRNVLTADEKVPLAEVVAVTEAAKVVEAVPVQQETSVSTKTPPVVTAELVTVKYTDSPMSNIQKELNKRGLYMSDGALIATIIGSAIGLALLVAIIVGVIIFCLCCRKSSKNSWVPPFQKQPGSTPWLARGGQKTN